MRNYLLTLVFVNLLFSCSSSDDNSIETSNFWIIEKFQYTNGQIINEPACNNNPYIAKFVISDSQIIEYWENTDNCNSGEYLESIYPINKIENNKIIINTENSPGGYSEIYYQILSESEENITLYRYKRYSSSIIQHTFWLKNE